MKVRCDASARLTYQVRCPGPTGELGSRDAEDATKLGRCVYKDGLIPGWLGPFWREMM